MEDVKFFSESHEEAIKQLLGCFQELFTHHGHGKMTVEMRFLKRGQKEILINCGKEYRFTVDCCEKCAKGKPCQATENKPVENVQENTAQESEEALGLEGAPAENVLPESNSISAIYLKTFKHSGKRDPFSRRQSDGAQVDTSWWQEATEQDEVELNPEELRFDGRKIPSRKSYERLPLIKVTGLMQVGDKRAVSAIIQNKGSVILYENDNVVIEANSNTNLTKSLIIKEIRLNGMTVILDDGNEITGKFY